MCSFDEFQKVDRLSASSVCIREKEKKTAARSVAYLFGALALDGDKDATLGSIGLGALHRQIRAANDAEDDLHIDDQRQTHSILSTTREPPCLTDGIERPLAYQQATRQSPPTRVRCDHLDHSHGRSRPKALPSGARS